MKAVRLVIAASGVPNLQTRLVRSHSTTDTVDLDNETSIMFINVISICFNTFILCHIFY